MRTIVTGLFLLAVSLLTGCETTGVSQSGTAAGIAGIVQRGELTVGTAGSMPPLNMTTKAGDIIGLDVDIARRMAGAMGVKLKIQAMPFNQLLPALEKGQVDMVISGMTITPQRNTKVAFVGPYFESGKAFLTKMDTIANAKDTTEINAPTTRLVALKGSTSEAFAKGVLPKAQLKTTEDYDEAIRLVVEDKAHALLADYPICVSALLRYPNAGLLSVITPVTYEPLGIALPADDTHLINFVENFIATMAGSGQLEVLTQRWFEDASWVMRLP